MHQRRFKPVSQKPWAVYIGVGVGSSAMEAMDDLTSDIDRDSIRPLVVDLDGTLIRTDILAEGVFAHIGSKLTGAIELVQALRGGKASLKHFLAHEKDVDSANLPYDPRVLALIAGAKSEGRRIYLATASH